MREAEPGLRLPPHRDHVECLSLCGHHGTGALSHLLSRTAQTGEYTAIRTHDTPILGTGHMSSYQRIVFKWVGQRSQEKDLNIPFPVQLREMLVNRSLVSAPMNISLTNGSVRTEILV